jgi:hypothetical protein
VERRPLRCEGPIVIPTRGHPLLNLWRGRRTSQSPQHEYFLLLVVAQDVAHSPTVDQVPSVGVNVSAGYAWRPAFRCRSVAAFGCPPRDGDTRTTPFARGPIPPAGRQPESGLAAWPKTLCCSRQEYGPRTKPQRATLGRRSTSSSAATNRAAVTGPTGRNAHCCDRPRSARRSGRAGRSRAGVRSGHDQFSENSGTVSDRVGYEWNRERIVHGPGNCLLHAFQPVDIVCSREQLGGLG